ncbi:MAG: TatD family hydrolase [candidate division Zixibacteria bacterium]|nr:TatD family hydrolase [candidate division Zixibacteria bacterium]
MIDSHCHLDFDKFDGQRDEAVKSAASEGVHTIINIGVDLASSLRSVELSEQHDSVYATVGVHPHDAKTFDDCLFDQLRQLCARKKVVAVGEIGLDFYRDHSPRDVQRVVFQRQLELAVETKLPVVIHTREAFDDTMAILTEYASQLTGAVFHCFLGDAAEADRVFDLGFLISFGGIITFKNSEMSRLAVEVPLEKVILETDAPYLTPMPHRGKTNYPAYVRFVYEKLAELKQISVAEVEKTVDRTCQKFFGLVETFGG